MNLLFLHPTPGLGWQDSYYLTALNIQKETGYQVSFVYNGPVIHSLGNEIPVYNFNKWVESNREHVTSVNIHDLEKRYPASNLWLSVVAERRFTNYSLLNSSFPTFLYNYDELIFYLKALVLFYEEIIQKHKIEAIFAHHTDNIHSAVLYEMSLSNKTLPLLIFPDYYWDKSSYYLFDNKYFTSSSILKAYKANLADYSNKVKPIEDDIQAYISHRVKKDPASQKKVLPQLGILKNTTNALGVLRNKNIRFYFFKPDIVTGYGHVCIPISLKSYFRRTLNLIQNRFSNIFSVELPQAPFVYFPLQRVPEAAMLSRATSYLNQQGLAQALSAALPAGFKLVIKDHPRSVGYHSRKYYSKLLELPNIVVVHPSIPNDLIFSKASLLVTIAGTLGFQSLLQGKPVLMFGRKFYECLEGVIRVSNINELPYVLKNILLFGDVPDRELIKKSVYSFIAALISSRYVSEATHFEINKNPDALTPLLVEMIEKELPKLLSTN